MKGAVIPVKVFVHSSSLAVMFSIVECLSEIFAINKVKEEKLCIVVTNLSPNCPEHWLLYLFVEFH